MTQRLAFPVFICILFAAVVFAFVRPRPTPQVRVYKEIVLTPSETPENSPNSWSHIKAVMPDHPPIEGMAVTDSSGASLRWKAPEGWREQPGSGMRLASFMSGDPSDPVECSIVRLSGPAGGKEANIRRWLGQINLPDLPDIELQAFLSHQEKLTVNETYPALLVDFTQLQTELPNEAPSTIAVMIEMADDSVFVKMTGTKAAVQNHVKQLRELALSIKPGESL